MLAPVDGPDLSRGYSASAVALSGTRKQRFGKAHQRDAFICIEPILLQEGIDPPLAFLLACAFDQRDWRARRTADAPAPQGRPA